ncbi:MAG: hypothetical protein D6712_11185 [Chloroflexi bacterium]|nr:MAG: hypothetical protein D6712_11185 [Chloroflexota bacterium]
MDDNTQSIAETENYEAWVSEEEDGELIFHLDLGRMTVHFFREEWDELRELMRAVEKQMRQK